MRRSYELQTFEAEDRHWWYRGRRRIVKDVLRGLPLPRPAQVLDAGCGGGRNLEELVELGAVTGLDPSEVAVEQARARGTGAVVKGELEALPFEEDRFDLATCLDVLEHIDDDRRALLELRRVVKPGGFLAVTVPAYPRLWSAHDAFNEHRRRYTDQTLLGTAAEAGWTPFRTTHFNALLLPVAVVYRLVQRWFPDSGRSEIESPAWLDSLFVRPLLAEAALIRAGARVPIGLSILAIFRA